MPLTPVSRYAIATAAAPVSIAAAACRTLREMPGCYSKCLISARQPPLDTAFGSLKATVWCSAGPLTATRSLFTQRLGLPEETDLNPGSIPTLDSCRRRPRPVLRSVILGTGAFMVTTSAFACGTAWLSSSAVLAEPASAKPPEVPQLEAVKLTDGRVVNILTSAWKESDDDKPVLVVLGSGWGAVALLRHIDPKLYATLVVSPTNYFLFSPLLPSATVGTVDLRTLVEPVRRLVKKLKSRYLHAEATDLDLDRKLVAVKGKDGKEFYVPFDKLVIAVGSQSNTFSGVPGLEYCNYLKNVDDVKALRTKIMRNFELAALPATPREERKRLLSFVICGGGPTGVEFAAELYDFVCQDLTRYFPKELIDLVQVSIIQSQDHILNTYDENISKYAEQKFKREGVNVVTRARVVAIEDGKIRFKQKPPVGFGSDQRSSAAQELSLPFGICLWSTGVSMRPFAQRLNERLKEQVNTRALETDEHMHLKGSTALGTVPGADTPSSASTAVFNDVYAIGDCSTIENPKLLEKLTALYASVVKQEGVAPSSADDKGLDFDQFQRFAKKAIEQVPPAKQHLVKLEQMFLDYDIDKSGRLDVEELKKLLASVDQKLTSLPATAQVANQQGIYVAKRLNKLAKNGDDESKMMTFNYKHMGSLAYVGSSAAVVDLGNTTFAPSRLPLSGGWAFFLWRSFYLSEQLSTRTRMLLAVDWLKRLLFGRDLSSI